MVSLNLHDQNRHDQRPDVPDDAEDVAVASVALQALVDAAPGEYLTLAWLLGRLRRRSFGMIILLLAVVALAPGICNIAGILLIIAAAQMVLGRAAPAFPGRIAARQLPTRHLAMLVRRVVPVLRRLETMVHPRWPVAMALCLRAGGIAIMLLGLSMSTIPIPLSNVAPAVAIGLIALAMLEQDGLLLVGALALSAVMLLGLGFVVWQAVAGAAWIGRIW